MAWVSKRSTPLSRGCTRATRWWLWTAVASDCTLRLVQQPVAGEAGTSFFFEVNGREVFNIGGANWIPDDNLLERITPERYRQRVEQAAAGNMNMLRVWAGGIYEDDAFTTPATSWACWSGRISCSPAGCIPPMLSSRPASAPRPKPQCAACATGPVWRSGAAITRTTPSPSPSARMARRRRSGAFRRARALYEELLPAVCAALDPDRPYWPGSPYSPNATGITLSSDPTVGDRHSWEVWHQAMLPTSATPTQSRFVSEFGMQAHPSLALLERSLPEAERYPESRTMVWHNKAGSGAPDGHRRLAVYLSDNLRAGTSLADQVYATQFIQAEAMRGLPGLPAPLAATRRARRGWRPWSGSSTIAGPSPAGPSSIQPAPSNPLGMRSGVPWRRSRSRCGRRKTHFGSR